MLTRALASDVPEITRLVFSLALTMLSVATNPIVGALGAMVSTMTLLSVPSVLLAVKDAVSKFIAPVPEAGAVLLLTVKPDAAPAASVVELP